MLLSTYMNAPLRPLGMVMCWVVSVGTTNGHSPAALVAHSPAATAPGFEQPCIEGGEGSTALPRAASVLRQGEDDVLFRISSYGKGRASKIPNPPRIAVLPVLNGS